MENRGKGGGGEERKRSSEGSSRLWTLENAIRGGGRGAFFLIAERHLRDGEGKDGCAMDGSRGARAGIVNRRRLLGLARVVVSRLRG